MINRLLLSITFLFTGIALTFGQVGQGALKGKVLDKETGEPLPFVNIALEQNGNIVTGASSDFDGKYTIKPIPPGEYTIKATFTGFQPVQINNIIVKAEKITFQDIQMGQTSINIEEFEVIEYTVPLIDKDNTSSGSTVTKENIGQMAARDATSIASTVGGVYSADDGTGDLNVRGSRSDANYYYIDGIKVRGSSGLPKSAIEQVTVITGGLPAQYGDVTGGVISITTRGASREYTGSIDYSTSGYKLGDNVVGLDPYAFNLLEFSAGGPLLWKKDTAGEKKEPILGFFLSGNATHIVDENPSAIGWWKINEDVAENINDDPLRFATTGLGTFNNHDFLRLNDLESHKTVANGARRGIQIAGKIDVNTSKKTNLTFGGSLDFSRNNRALYSYSLLNSHHNPIRTKQAWRVYSRFTQRFGSENSEESERSSSLIKNAFYSIQVDYSENKQTDYSEQHKDRFFEYGYVGKFRSYKQPTYGNEFVVDTLTGVGGYIQETFEDTLIGFEADTSINPLGSKITQSYYDLYGWEGYDENGNPIYDYENRDKFKDIVAVQTFGGVLNGDAFDGIYDLWANPATVYDQYRVTNNNQFRLSATGSADILDHAIMIGFEFEQRVDRGYDIRPTGLWEIGRQRTNSHISELDKAAPIIEPFGTYPRISYPRKNSAVGPYTGDDDQSFFDYNLRGALNLDQDGNDWIDFNSYGPETFDVSFFSADELLNSGNTYVNYWGYDHAGNKLKKDPKFEDFFMDDIDGNDEDGDGNPDNSAWDVYGNSLRGIGAFRPVYVAGFIQDKFSFDDLIFNVGLRVDRYDANQMVLKDPYVYFPTVKAGEEDALNLVDEHPDNVGDDWVVYVDDIKDPNAIVGYRDGTTWYNSEGAELDGPEPLKTATGIQPFLVDPDKTQSTLMNGDAFEDYTPQTNFMPRIAFSFPISDEALFSAHYDVLTKRPTTAARLNPMNYYFGNNRGRAISGTYLNNPNLKPEKTIDYEVGFQQKLTKSSSITLSAFYRELRDMVQTVNIVGTFPVSNYVTFGNIDFGTVKGLTVKYDMRRTGNVQMNAYYTLQFAEGTGSDAFAGINLARQGAQTLRATNPLSFDQRHAITVNVDYRYGEKGDYNGPLVGDMQVLANTGANLQFNAGSGTPYSKQRSITGEAFINPIGSSVMDGKINGSRLPWQFRMDMKLDRDIALEWGGKEEGEKKKTAQLNVYLQILNVLNTKNIISVYRATGNTDDDGYLTAPQYQNIITSSNNEQSLRELYNIKVHTPFSYNLPRRFRLGVMLNF